jgi:DNA topoisomerase-1
MLRYVSDNRTAGITRHGGARHFYYRKPSGARLKDPSTLKRIAKMAIPPAWTRVWIAPFPDAHLFATGRDRKGRKQYRYNPRFSQVRNAAKYEHLVEFASGLPKLRRRLKRDLARPGMPREKILASIVTLLQETLIRIGNEDYAKSNHSFGLTTLRNGHVKVKGTQLLFLFKGKSGKEWNLSIRDRRVAKIVRSCQELPGQHLFEYRDIGSKVRAVSSTDVNTYLREISRRDITAKDFRTWAATVKAALAFHALGDGGPKSVRGVITQVAEELGNTVAVCRKCYIHPQIIADFEAGKLSLRLPHGKRDGFGPQEFAVLAYLRQAASHAAKRAGH